MTTRFKSILIITFILLPVLCVVGYYIWQALQLNNYKPLIEQQVTKAIGNQVAIKGPIHMSASLTPIITIQNIIIANPAWANTKNAATIQKLTMQISFKQIMKGKVLIPKIIIYDPQVLLEKNKQGQYNWDFDSLAKALDNLPKILKPLKLNIVTEQGKLDIKQAGGLRPEIELLHTNIKLDDAKKIINIAASATVKIIPVKFISRIDYNGKITKGPYRIKAKVNGLDVEFEI